MYAAKGAFIVMHAANAVYFAVHYVTRVSLKTRISSQAFEHLQKISLFRADSEPVFVFVVVQL